MFLTTGASKAGASKAGASGAPAIQGPETVHNGHGVHRIRIFSPTSQSGAFRGSEGSGLVARVRDFVDAEDA